MKKARRIFVMLNFYTVVLIGLFLNIQNQPLAWLLTLFMLLLNAVVSMLVRCANQKEIKVHFLVGKSKRRELIDDLLLNSLSIGLSLGIFSLGLLIFKAIHWDLLGPLLLISLVMIGLKAMLLILLMRKSI